MTTHAAQQAQIYLHRGNLTQAQYWCTQAVDEARTQGTWDTLASALGNLGNVYALLEDFQQAEACYQEVLTIQRSQDNPNTIGETLANIGNVKADAGDYTKARAYYLEAIDVLTATENYRALGILYGNLALQEVATDQQEDAIGHFKYALAFHRTVGDEVSLANTYSQLGQAFLTQGEFRQAEGCLNNASEHFIKLGNEPSEAAVLRVLAELYKKKNDTISAIRCLERTIQIDIRYQLPEQSNDFSQLTQLRKRTTETSDLKPPKT
jgi:tetratricopeptide (TPR) repeat protein